MMEKTFNPAQAETRIYDAWEQSGAFQPKDDPNAKPFCIVIPPPNVTGRLHIGHALNNTLQDVLSRYKRMLGDSVLWQPGTDHAGIATQMVVERQLAANQDPSRRDMGREKFVERVWEWKEESGGMILQQLRRLGASCDWSRERFTLDEGLSEAVLNVFVELYKQGLMYRGKRLVNWDPKFETAISDLEVENIEVDGHMWHFKYPLAGGKTYTYVEKDEDGNVTLTEERDYISIATTRPETMLGDGAVAVHPDDERYAPIVGELCEIPVGPKEHRRLIPIITDEYPDPEFGSGAVKITGAHDFNDYEVAKRNNIPLYRLMDTQAAMRADGPSYDECATKAQAIARGADLPSEAEVDAINLVPDDYRGLDRFEAREKIIADITAEGLAVMVTPEAKDGDEEAPQPIPLVENKKIQQPFGDRSNVVIEPMLTDQWFANAGELAKEAIAAVEDGRTTFHPKNWEKTYFEWMRNIQPWCVSRQLWWGHRIPVWSGPKRLAYLLESEEEGASHDWDSWKTNPDERVEFAATSRDDLHQQLADYYSKDPLGQNISIDTSRCFAEITGEEDRADGDFGYRLGGGLRDEFFQIDVNCNWRGEEGVGFCVLSERDTDVLDTWFSSALWPFSTLGWPDKTPEVAKFYPNTVLITAFDIIFFWVARMMMQGLHFMKDEDGKPQVPFKDVYIHALVRDEKGQKMSKSKGNVIDPLELVDEYGADAVRFTLAAQAGQGRDIRMSTQRVEGYRNFGTKLWNAARFCEMNECAVPTGFEPSSVTQTVNKWILAEAQSTVAAVNKGLDEYRFNEAAAAAYRFVWNIFCDWHLEFAKPLFGGEDAAAKAETQATTAYVLDVALKILHPFMPFVTEALWAETAKRDTQLIVADWPQLDGLANADAEAEMSWLIDVITNIRSLKAEMNIAPGKPLNAVLVGASQDILDRVERNRPLLARMARLEEISASDSVPPASAQTVVGETVIALPLDGVIDLDAERDRLAKELKKLDGEIMRLEKKLGNAKFVANAPEEVVAGEKTKLADYTAQKTKVSEALGRLETA
ncbi:MAG: valine--tRNA ligase [Maricaulis sp.]|uniref:valine--tRNA ligase n=1 Tax=Maricaulis sp. TaxID=1486257 RepID=UPI001B23F333|nr:valine--tRNA ligase [Maricaulis sp.]MBO6728665.1 valine--tRNA ligase [Maricaulis sp.]MBO6848207.1 valine--tRNA ligase [Maricaulis sp.]MBO6877932.1 valine--tRNA ligase [Maricaulis sp.]